MSCPLCRSLKVEQFDQDKFRHYLRCSVCGLVYVPREEMISPEDEKKRYDSHQNSETDPGYRHYLKQIADSIRPYLNKNDQGLDFGCGRSKLMEEIFKDGGFQVSSFDLYYHPEKELLKKKYHFLILSEVIEHLRDPREVMMDLKNLLHPGGRIFIKTKCYPTERREFSQWFYKRDLTHVQFFNESSFEELGSLLKLESVRALGDDLYLFLSTIEVK